MNSKRNYQFKSTLDDTKGKRFDSLKCIFCQCQLDFIVTLTENGSLNILEAAAVPNKI